MNETIYKIKRKSDGKFSNGGSTPSFTKHGKSWSNEGQLKSHLRMVKFTPEVYTDCIIVEYELVVTEQVPFSLEKWIETMKEDKTAAKLAGKTTW